AAAQDIVRDVANRAGITRPVRPHVLRHTFATTALQKGSAWRRCGRYWDTTCCRQRPSIYPNLTDVQTQDEFSASGQGGAPGSFRGKSQCVLEGPKSPECVE
ncbi:MAG: hypothetical protein WKF75_13745, partial [Singulisphaera sp.]